MNTRETMFINDKGHLEIGGCDAVKLANAFGTPLYVMDEAHIRKVALAYKNSVEKNYGDGEIAYASKAFSTTAAYALMNGLGLSVDLVSEGELYTALRAGFPLSRAYLHGNNKSFPELETAVANGIGVIIIESADELLPVNHLAQKYGRVQKIMIRVNPGVEAHTHEFIQTANTDSKFGVQLDGDEINEIFESLGKYKYIEFYGLAFHIGSQIFDIEPYLLSVDIVTNYMRALKDEGFVCKALNVGGGFGVYYNDDDEKVTPETYSDMVAQLSRAVIERVDRAGLPRPKLILEPGRSIVAEAGITLYTAGTIKDIKNVRKYVAVDGGMFENPRYALYGARYSAIVANRANAPADDVVTLAGKCCESGDIIAKDVRLQRPLRGDVIAVFSTGAYNYSMSSNYNRNRIPPVVLVKDGAADYIVKPQTLEDVIRNDCVPTRLTGAK